MPQALKIIQALPSSGIQNHEALDKRSLVITPLALLHLVVKERQRGYDEATFVESFVILNAAGGECLDDFERLRADPGLASKAYGSKADESQILKSPSA